MQIYFKLTYSVCAFYRPRARNETCNCDRQADFKKQFLDTRVRMECTVLWNSGHHCPGGVLAGAGSKWEEDDPSKGNCKEDVCFG